MNGIEIALYAILNFFKLLLNSTINFLTEFLI